MLSNLVGRRLKNYGTAGTIVAVWVDRGTPKALIENPDNVLWETDLTHQALEPALPTGSMRDQLDVMEGP